MHHFNLPATRTWADSRTIEGWQLTVQSPSIARKHPGMLQAKHAQMDARAHEAPQKI